MWQHKWVLHDREVAKCPSEWLLEISADAPLHKTINWCQCERVTQTMPGKREKGQRQVTKMLKVLKESIIEEAITSLMKKMPHYLQHVFVQRKQTRFFQEKFKTLMRKRQLFRLILQRMTLAFNRMKFKQPAGVKNKWLSSPWWSGAKVVKTRPCVIPMPLSLMTIAMKRNLWQCLWTKYWVPLSKKKSWCSRSSHFLRRTMFAI